MLHPPSPRSPPAALICALTLVSPAAHARQDAAEPAGEDWGLSGDWGGARAALEERGVTLGVSLLWELNHVPLGGVRNSTTGHSLVELNATFDLQRLLGIENATVFVDAYSINGHNPSDDTGDYQSFSDISSGRDRAQIAEFYYEQWYADDTWRLKLGKMDANTDFAAPAVTSEGIHSSSAFSPTNFTLVTYPDPATGIVAGWVPNERWSARIGVYDGAAWAGVSTGSRGPSTFFGAPSDLLWIAELGRRWSCGEARLPGGCSLGTWRHSGDFPTTGGGSDEGAEAYYLTLDQVLREGAETGSTAAFLQFGWADADVASIDLHLGAGLVQTGVGARRPDDACGAYLSCARFVESAGFSEDFERAFELYYKCRLLPDVILRPDLQWIANPGADATLDDVLAFSLRLELNL